MRQDIVIKIGGSIIYKDDMSLNIPVLEKIKKWYVENEKKYNKIVLVTGGGKLSRNVGNLVNPSITNTIDKHGVAMLLTQTSSAIIKGYLNIDKAVIPDSLGDAFEALNDENVSVLISGGLKRGWSTDMDSVVFADILNLKKVIKLTNVDYLYSSDPRENKDAKPIMDITWDKYNDMFNRNRKIKHSVNGNVPISVEASEFCTNREISFQISGGKNLYSAWKLNRIMQEGTLIHP